METTKRILAAIALSAALTFGFAFGARAQAAAAPAAGSDVVLAEFDGGKITVEQVNLFLNTINPQYLAQLQSPQMKDMLVNQLVESAVLASLARSIGVDKDPEVAATIFLQTNSILASRYFEKEIKPQRDAVQISDAELQKYYEDHKSEFEKNEVKASHILVDTEEEAKELYKQLKAAPDTFAAVAKEKSKDKGSAVNGGDLGWFGKGRMVPAFEEAAFKTPKGTISDPVKTQFGWHLIKVEDVHEKYIPPFDEVKDQISNELLDGKKKEVVDTYLKALKEKMHLKTYPENNTKVGPPAAEAAPGADQSAVPPAPPAPAETKTSAKQATKQTDTKKKK